MKIPKIIVLLTVGICIANASNGQIGAALLQKKMMKNMEKKANSLDESMSESASQFVDENTSKSVSVVPDGTSKITLRCPIPSGAEDLKKMAMQKQFYWKLIVTATSNSAAEEEFEEVIFDDDGKVDSWKTYLKDNGEMEFEINETDIKRHLIAKSGNHLDQEMKVKVDFRSNSSQGWVQFATSEFTINCDGPNGKWAKGDLESTMTAFKSGRYYEGNTDSPEFKRMLKYAQNKWPKADIVHMKIMSSGVGDDGRINYDLYVTRKDADGTCQHTNVAVWEQQITNAFSNFVPQFGSTWSDAACARIEEIRNVR